MKRADLKPGQDYLVSGSNDWTGDRARIYRVRVIDLAPVAALYRTYGSKATSRTITLSTGEKLEARASQSSYGSGGDGVLVEYLDGRNAGRGPVHCPVREIRAPWADGKAEVDAERAAVKAARQVTDERRADVDRRYQGALAALPAEARALMPDSPNGDSWAASVSSTIQTSVRVPVEALEAIATALQDMASTLADRRGDRV